MKGLLTVAALAAVLGLSVFAAYRTWIELSGVTISTNGMIALVAGIVATLALGAGLMFLMYLSHRRGYDDPDPSTPPDSRD